MSKRIASTCLHRIGFGVHNAMFSAAFPSVFDAASSDGTSDSESEQHTAIAPLSKRPLSDRLDTAATAMLGEMAEQLEVIEPPAKRARVPDLDTGVNAMLGEILSHELPPLDDGSLDGSLDVLRHEPPSLSTDLDFFLTNLETEIESTPSASPSVSPPLPLQPPAAKRKSGGGGGGGGGSRKDWEPWEDEAIRNFVESKEVARDRGDAPRPLRRRGAQPLGARAGRRSRRERRRRRRRCRRRRRRGGAANQARARAAPGWTAEEDAIISQSVGEAGSRWSLIVTRLPNTEHAIRNRWHRSSRWGRAPPAMPPSTRLSRARSAEEQSRTAASSCASVMYCAAQSPRPIMKL